MILIFRICKKTTCPYQYVLLTYLAYECVFHDLIALIGFAWDDGRAQALDESQIERATIKTISFVEREDVAQVTTSVCLIMDDLGLRSGTSGDTFRSTVL